MWFHIFRSIGRATRGPVALLVLVTSCTMAQSPGASSPRPQEQLQERERLIKQVDELRRAGKLDEAVAAAERALELERRAGGEASPREAEALARLAELHELRGDWVQAVGRRKEALAIRMERGWEGSLADGRRPAGPGVRREGCRPGGAERAKVQAALRREQEAARLEAQGKFAEAERVALEALETYRALVGPESAEVARAWHRIGRCRSARQRRRRSQGGQRAGAAIRRKVLPGTHPESGAA